MLLTIVNKLFLKINYNDNKKQKIKCLYIGIMKDF